MTMKQIDGLTVDDRLRGGTVLELQDPTNGSGNITIENLLLGTQMDSTSQIIDDGSDVAEVEANTRALRVTPRPRDLVVPGYQVSRHTVGLQCTQASTNTVSGATATPIVLGCWSARIGGGALSGLALLNKVTVSMDLSAISGVRSGVLVTRMDLQGLAAMGTFEPGAIWAVPPSGSSSLTPENYSSLKTRQPSPVLAISSVSNNGSLTGFSGFTTNLGTIFGNSGVVAGTNMIPPSTLFDAWGSGSYQPYVMSANCGFVVNFGISAIGTSQTLDFSVTLQWDEFVRGSEDLL